MTPPPEPSVQSTRRSHGEADEAEHALACSPQGMGRTRDIRWARAVPFGLGVLVLATAFPGLLTGRSAYFYGDLWRMQYPIGVFVSEQLRSGWWPLWWPYEALGTPLSWAAVAGIFHPKVLLHLALPPWMVLQVEIVLVVFVATTGSWALARHLHAQAWAAAVAAVAYPLSGGFLGQIHTISYGWGAALFPWLMLGGSRALQPGTRTSGVLQAAAALALTGMAGDLQGVYFGGGTALLFMGGMGARSLRPVSIVALLGAILALAVLLGAVQWFPSMEAAVASGRAEGLPWSVAAGWSLAPHRLLDLFVGDLSAWRPWQAPGADSLLKGGAWLATVTVGPVVLVGAVWAIALRNGRARADWVLGTLVLTLLILALGRFGGLYRLFFHTMPLWSAFRFPEKMVPYASLLLAVLASRGLTRARATTVRQAWRSIAAALGTLVLLSAGGSIGSQFVAPGEWQAWTIRLGWAAALSAGIAFVVVGTVTVPTSGRNRAILAIPTLVVIVHLAYANGGFTRAGMADPAVFDAPMPVADALARHGNVGLGAGRATSEFSRGMLIPETAEGGIGRPLRQALWQRAVLLTEHNALAKIESTSRYLPSSGGQYAQLAREDPGRWFKQLLPLYGNAFLVTTPADSRRISPVPADQVAHSPELNVVVLKYHRPLPRAFVAHPLFVNDAATARLALSKPQVASGRAVVVGEPIAFAAQGDPKTTPGTVSIRSWAPQQIELTARLDEPGVLVVNDAWAPGWLADVDGAAREILRANVLVRGLALEPGRHEIVLTYRGDRGTRIGAVVSALTWGLVGLGWLVRRGRWGAGVRAA